MGVTKETTDDSIFYESKLTLLTRIKEYGKSQWYYGFKIGFFVGVGLISSLVFVNGSKLRMALCNQ